MTFSTLRIPAQQYALIALMLAGSWFVSSHIGVSIEQSLLSAPEEARTLLILLVIVIVLALGFIVYELAKPTILPSFVLAIFFGMGVRESLTFLTESPVSMMTLITIGAALILFSGGLETPFHQFRLLIGPILSLAIIGTILSAILLSLLSFSGATILGFTIPPIAIVLMGSALASTDPAAIIPSLQSLVFDSPRVKHIAVSESAINDVVGAVLVGVFLELFAEGAELDFVLTAYRMLFSLANIAVVLRIIFGGLLAGLVGYGILQVWSKWKERVQTEGDSDAALFLAVPLAAFTIASIAGGSGFLAVFLVGLFFSLRSHMRHVEHYFNHTIEAFMKPLIFILLGATVDPTYLLHYASIGIPLGLLFMFVLRPLIVLGALGPFCFFKYCFTIRELLFLSFVRETGVIPAALLITVKLAGIPGADAIGAISLWVILLTLIIEPPLTPFVARRLGVAHNVPKTPKRKHKGPVAVLCSRGYSFPERMQVVLEWALQHGVENIALLHCPENKYSETFVSDVRKRAQALFRSMNRQLASEGRPEMNFEFLCGPGLLQENIEALIAEDDVSIIFVGSKMLDYRLQDVKRLDAPFYFL